MLCFYSRYGRIKLQYFTKNLLSEMCRFEKRCESKAQITLENVFENVHLKCIHLSFHLTVGVGAVSIRAKAGP